MITLESVVIRLQNVSVTKVKIATGINRMTLHSIRNGSTPNPTYLTFKSLSDYFENEDIKARNA